MVADTYSTTLGVLLMGTGNDSTTWGNNCNVSVFQILEDSIANVFTSSATSGTVDLSTTPPPSGPTQARYWQLKFTGNLTGNLIVKVPNLTKEWLLNNQCTLNGFGLLMQTPTGAQQTIPAGWQRVWCDGNNVINLWPFGASQVLMSGAPTASTPSYSSYQEPGGGFYRNANQDWRVTANGVDVARFTGTGSAGGQQLFDILSGTSLAFAGTKFDQTAIVPSGTEVDWAGVFAPTGWYLEDGSAKSRTTDANLFNAITATCTGNTHTTTTVDSLSFNPTNLGLEGAFVEGTGIPTGTTVVSTATSSIVLSQAAISTSTGITIRFLPWGQGDAVTTFNIPDRRGVVIAGRDNMSGTAKGLLTLAQSQGILGTKLNTSGGEQGHTTVLAESPTGQFTFNDVSHTHTTSTNIPQFFTTGINGGNAGGLGAFQSGQTTPTVTVNSSVTGCSITDHAGGGAHNNVQPTAIANKIIKR